MLLFPFAWEGHLHCFVLGIFLSHCCPRINRFKVLLTSMGLGSISGEPLKVTVSTLSIFYPGIDEHISSFIVTKFSMLELNQKFLWTNIHRFCRIVTLLQEMGHVWLTLNNTEPVMCFLPSAVAILIYAYFGCLKGSRT